MRSRHSSSPLKGRDEKRRGEERKDEKRREDRREVEKEGRRVKKIEEKRRENKIKMRGERIWSRTWVQREWRCKAWGTGERVAWGTGGRVAWEGQR